MVGKSAEDIMLTVGIDYSAIQKAAKRTRQTINSAFKGAQKQAKYAADSIHSVDKTMGKLGAQAKRATIPFAGWAMSIMFFGMALKRMFDTIWKSSQKTFNDVMHSVDGTVTGFDMMKGSLAYLGFVAGEALEPIAYWLVPIIDKISEWIMLNPKLFSTLTTIFGVLGTAFLVGGSGWLALNGFRDLAGIITGLDTSKISFAGLGSMLATPVGAGVLAALAALAVLAGLSWKAFSETPEAWEAMKQVLADSVKDLKAYGDYILDAISNILEFEVAWEDLAWTIVWATKIAIEMIKLSLSPLRSMIELLIIAANSYLALNKAKRGDITGIASHISAIQTAMLNLKDIYFRNPFDIASKIGTPGSLKAEYERNKNNEEYIDKNTDFANPYALENQPTTIILQVDGQEISGVVSETILGTSSSVS